MTLGRQVWAFWPCYEPHQIKGFRDCSKPARLCHSSSVTVTGLSSPQSQTLASNEASQQHQLTLDGGLVARFVDHGGGLKIQVLQQCPVVPY
jgi:hypothetical protein